MKIDNYIEDLGKKQDKIMNSDLSSFSKAGLMYQYTKEALKKAYEEGITIGYEMGVESEKIIKSK